MRRLHISVMTIIVAFVFVLLTVPLRTEAQCTFEWKPNDGLTGLNGTVYATALYDDGGGPALYAGGSFTIAGTTRANNIAKWDGPSWSPLDTGTSSDVLALSVYNGDLIVG